MSTFTFAREGAHDDRALQRLEHGGAQLRARLLLGQAGHVDAADGDPLADLLGVGAVVREHASGEDQDQQADDAGDDSSTGTHGGPHDGRRRRSGREPLQSRWRLLPMAGWRA